MSGNKVQQAPGDAAALGVLNANMAAAYMAVNHPIDLGAYMASRTENGTPEELVTWRYAMIGGLLLPRLGEPKTPWQRERNYLTINALYSILGGTTQLEHDSSLLAMKAAMAAFRRETTGGKVN